MFKGEQIPQVFAWGLKNCSLRFIRLWGLSSLVEYHWTKRWLQPRINYIVQIREEHFQQWSSWNYENVRVVLKQLRVMGQLEEENAVVFPLPNTPSFWFVTNELDLHSLPNPSMCLLPLFWIPEEVNCVVHRNFSTFRKEGQIKVIVGPYRIDNGCSWATGTPDDLLLLQLGSFIRNVKRFLNRWGVED